MLIVDKMEYCTAQKTGSLKSNLTNYIYIAIVILNKCYHVVSWLYTIHLG